MCVLGVGVIYVQNLDTKKFQGFFLDISNFPHFFNQFKFVQRFSKQLKAFNI